MSKKQYIPNLVMLTVFAAPALLSGLLVTSCSQQNANTDVYRPNTARIPKVSATLSPPAPSESHLIVLSIWPGFLQGGGTSTGTAVLDAPAPRGGIKVDLSSDQRQAGITVPASVVVPQGHKVIDFPIRTVKVPTPVVAWITATSGPNVRTNTVQARPAFMIASPVVGGNSVGASIALRESAPQSGTVVALSSRSSLVKPGRQVNIHAGDSTMDLTIPTSVVAVPTTAAVSAIIEGRKVTQNVEMLPVAARIALDPSKTSQSGRISGTINLSVPVSRELKFSISSSSRSVIPSQAVTFKPGEVSETYYVTIQRRKSPIKSLIAARCGVLTAETSLVVP